MRHQKRTQTLDRAQGPRRALIRTLTVALVDHETIVTTPARARAVQRFVEPLIRRGVSHTLANQRIIIQRIGNTETAKKIIHDIAPRFQNRSGGFTRRIKVLRRKGDASEQVQLEFVKL